MKKFLFVLLACSICVVFVGCQRAVGPKSEFKNDKLVFTFSKKDKRKSIKVFSFELYKENCKSDCVYWHVVNKIDEETGRPNFITIHDGIIEYGQSFPKMDLKMPAKKLDSGAYLLSGDVTTAGGGRMLYYEFSIDIDASGNRFVVQDSQ